MMPKLKPFLFIQLNRSVSLLVIFSLVLHYSHQISADVISDGDSFEDGASSLRDESGKFVHAGKFRRSTRVKKGGVLSDFYSNSNNSNNNYTPNKTTTTVSNTPKNVKSNSSSPSFSSLHSTSTGTANQYFPLVKRQSHRESIELTEDDQLFPVHSPFNSEILQLFSRSNLNLYPHTRSHIHEHHHNHNYGQGSTSSSSSDVIRNYLDEHFTKGGMKTNRFYFFNDRLPATRLANVNIYGDGQVQPTPNVHALQFRHKLRQKLRQNMLHKLKKKLLKSKKSHKKEHDKKRNVDKIDSPVRQNSLIDEIEQDVEEEKQNKKNNNNNNDSKNDKKDEWKPLYVTTKYRPFHFHLPILTNAKEPKELIDFQDVLQDATEYKNPLDFNFAANPESEVLLRRKRGIGSFLKKLFHINKKTTTERPRPPPAPPSPPPPPPPPPSHRPSDEDSYEEEYEEPDYDDTFGASASNRKSSGSPSSSGKNRHRGRAKSDLETKYKLKKPQREPSKRVTYHADQHGDTEIDWLLPKSLRKSSILVRNDVSNPVDDDIDAEAMAGDQALFYDDDIPEESAPLPPPKGKQRRRKNKRIHNRRKNWSFHDDDDDEENDGTSKDFKQGERHYDDGDDDGESPRRRGTRRRKHKVRKNQDELDLDLDDEDESQDYPRNSEPRRRNSNHGSTERVIGKPGIPRRSKRSTEHFAVINNNNWAYDQPKNQNIDPVDDNNFPIDQASKEELRLLHELFVNIVKGKCPKNFETTFVDSLEMNLFRIIDSSTQLEDTNKETSLEITKLIHQLVNCSIEAERSRDILNDKFNNYLTNANEIEVGGPLYRSKRKLTLNKKSKRQNNLDNNKGSNSKREESYSDDLINLSNFEFSLITFVGDECRANVNEILLQSAGQLILETIQDFYKGFLHISDEQYETNLNVLQTCANLIIRHREEEARLKRKLQNLNIDSSWLWSKEVEGKQEENAQRRFPKSDMPQNGDFALNSDLPPLSETEMRELLNEFKLSEGRRETEYNSGDDTDYDSVDSNIFSIFQDLANLAWKKKK